VTWTGPDPIGATRVDIASAYLRDIAWGATDPDPASGTTGIPITGTTLKWGKFDPPGDPIIEYDVYLGTEPNDLVVTLLDTVTAPTQEIATGHFSATGATTGAWTRSSMT